MASVNIFIRYTGIFVGHEQGANFEKLQSSGHLKIIRLLILLHCCGSSFATTNVSFKLGIKWMEHARKIILYNP